MEDKVLIILGALLGISEAIALIPALKSNSILQMIGNGLKKALGFFKKK